MKRIYLLRHGEPNVTGRYLGASDIAMSEAGKSHITSRRSFFSDIDFDQIYCSPLERCSETFELLSLDSKAEFDKRLMEINFGAWELKTFNEISMQYPDKVKEWSDDTAAFCFPGGEAITAFRHRIADFARMIFQNENKTILIISHGGVIRHLLCIFLKIPLEQYLLFEVDYGKVSMINLYSEGGVLKALNW